MLIMIHGAIIPPRGIVSSVAFWVLIKFLRAASAAEIVFLAFVLPHEAFCLSCFFIYRTPHNGAHGSRSRVMLTVMAATIHMFCLFLLRVNTPQLCCGTMDPTS